MRGLAVTQTLVKKPSANAGEKNSQMSNQGLNQNNQRIFAAWSSKKFGAVDSVFYLKTLIHRYS